MTRELVELSLVRSGPSQPWGFRIVGGRDEGLVCRVEKVRNFLTFKGPNMSDGPEG